MNINIPDKTKEIIEQSLNHGDFALISKKMYGDDSRRQAVRMAIKNSWGNEKMVTAIVKFYDKKAKTLKQLA